MAYKILHKRYLNSNVVEMEIDSPHIASSGLPGQFLIVRTDQYGERIPLTICDTNPERGSVTIIFQIVGRSTQQMSDLNPNDSLANFVGPLGKPSELIHLPVETLHRMNILFIGGGIGTAPIYPQVKRLKSQSVDVDVVLGFRNREMIIYEEEMRMQAKNLYLFTDDGSFGQKGFVTDALQYLVENQGKKYDLIVAVGPMIMMKNVVETAKRYGIKTVVSLNSMMVDGTGMCGACRVSVDGKTQFTCVDGPEFEGEKIDFDLAMRRQAMYTHVSSRHVLEKEEKREGHQCFIGGVTDEQPDRFKAVPVRNQPPQERVKNFDEVCYGYHDEEAMQEAKRCLQCKNAPCIGGCPVEINIPLFIRKIAEGDFASAGRVIAESSVLPAVCGRVCPQETQCEGVCVMGKKYQSVAIGKLERFAADWNRKHPSRSPSFAATERNHKVAIVGSGPAGLTCAVDLRKMGYGVDIFEALHTPGGVLMYGIPEFRLPKNEVVAYEIDQVLKMGVKIHPDMIIGKTLTVDDLLDKEGFDAVFIASGAGLPNFMGIPGENLNGVVSANEFLTRNNLMKSYHSHYLTPNYVGKQVCVVGGGNVAMDAARTAVRLGAEVRIVYRRSEQELPARAEEVHHAKEEGIAFFILTNPVEIMGDKKGWVSAIKCVRMELGNADDSGRRSPVAIAASEFVMPSDMVIISIGTSPNPLIAATTPNLTINRWKCIQANEDGQTSRQGVFAGGDAVSGAATVILAMGAGRKAAQAIDSYIRAKYQ
jgi:glutamate synthase (NADPH/NADH) small chain